MAMSLLFVFVFVFVTFVSVSSSSSSSSSSSRPPPSSCGNLTNIICPLRLDGDSNSCGRWEFDFKLHCENNQTILRFKYIDSPYYYVKEINYSNHTIRVVDPGLIRGNLSSCPHNPLIRGFPLHHEGDFLGEYMNTPVAFVHCFHPVTHSRYVKAAFCGKRGHAQQDTSYSYVIVGDMTVGELEDSCTVDLVTWGPKFLRSSLNNSLESTYHGLAFGFEIWSRPNNLPSYIQWWEYIVALWSVFHRYIFILIASLVCLRFVFGFPFLMTVVVYKWRRRHLSADREIEEFLQDQENQRPIQYSYSEIKKMTNNFQEKVGEGGCGIVYKAKLRSGPYAAVKMMEHSRASEDEFINEVSSIGQIHHFNVVRLIGFCVERSKYALVYEFLENGSLDRFIFNKVATITYEKMLGIALGVARGINYLHHGCNVQILHFDIKPHNILLDANFNPKISDFGLAKLHPTNESFVNLSEARGTVGYMAPELFYRNLIGRISHKADVYSFGMMMMEMVSKRKNLNPLLLEVEEEEEDESSQVYFPSWVYDQLRLGNDIIGFEDAATEAEKKIIKKIIIVALWCIQMRPAHRPPMNRVIDMLECDVELRIPPKPFVAPHEMMMATTSNNNRGGGSSSSSRREPWRNYVLEIE